MHRDVQIFRGSLSMYGGFSPAALLCYRCLHDLVPFSGAENVVNDTITSEHTEDKLTRFFVFNEVLKMVLLTGSCRISLFKHWTLFLQAMQLSMQCKHLAWNSAETQVLMLKGMLAWRKMTNPGFIQVDISACGYAWLIIWVMTQVMTHMTLITRHYVFVEQYARNWSLCICLYLSSLTLRSEKRPWLAPSNHRRYLWRFWF